VSAKLADVSANAFAADIGAMFKARKNLTLAGVLSNAGGKLTFLDQPDPLPLNFRLGAAYQPFGWWILSADAVYRKSGPSSFHAGAEWKLMPAVALRAGYRTDTLEGLGPLAGLTLGVGVNAWGAELAYAWLPMGELGNTHYLSLVLRLGENRRQLWNFVSIRHYGRNHATDLAPDKDTMETRMNDPEYQQLMQLLSDDDLRERTVRAGGSQDRNAQPKEGGSAQ
jgi:hypothetical protein